jgi:hypothetical protein
MYFKEQRYEKMKAATLAATYTKELPESGFLDSISLFLYTKTANPITLATPNNIHHHITKIEVIGDTDKTLFSLSGEEALAKAYRKMGALPPFKQVEVDNSYNDLTIPLFFGRKFKDGKYALDLSKWDKVELKITNDFTTDLLTAASFWIDTRLCTIEDSVEAHPKFLKQWEYEAEKPSADTMYVRPKLPSKGLLRSLMIQLDPDLTTVTNAVAQDPMSDNYNWKLFFKDRALTIFDHRPRDLVRNEAQRLGIGHSCLKRKPSIDTKVDHHWAEVLALAAAADYTGTDKTPPTYGGSRDRYQEVEAVGTCQDAQEIIQGIGLFHTFEIPFYLPDDEEANYLNLEQYKPVEIEWYGYKDDNTHRIILEKPIGQGPSEYA